MYLERSHFVSERERERERERDRGNIFDKAEVIIVIKRRV